jgi:pimeloyl-ACP methyl ester carboxylesterase
MRGFLLAIALVAGLVAGAAQAPYDPFAEAKHAEVNGTSLAYVERGTGGTPVVLVHGSGADLRTWGYQLQHFARSRRTLAYSRRFHHPNAPPAADAPYRPGDHADDLAGFIRGVAGGRADVVAASYGAVVALLAAGEAPSLFRRLVLVEPVAFALLDAGAPAGLDAARRLLVTGETEPALRAFISTVIAPGAYELMPASTRDMLHDNLPELMAEARAPLPTTDAPYTCADVRRAAVPALVVDGGASAPFLRAMASKVAACLPGARTHTFNGVAHAAHAQQVEAFNAVVQAFLDED